MNLRHGCLLALLALGMLAGGTGCSNTDKYNESLRKQNQEYAAQVAADKAQLDAMQKQIDELSATPAATQPVVVDNTPTTGPAATESSPDMGALEGGGITERQTARGETELEIVGDVLFAPGKAAIKPAAKAVLAKAVAMIKSKYLGHRLRVEGHTDPTPVGKSGWDDNYDLGAARARAVLLYLKSQGVPEKSMYLASFGANDLRSTKNLALDRRVDIVVEK